MFNQLRYDATVVEGSPGNLLVVTVSATDIDTTGETISYFLDKQGEMFFTIGPENGEIRTSGRPLDREETPVLYFKVQATDGIFIGSAGVKV